MNAAPFIHHNVENTNLEAHVSICSERFIQLSTKLESLDKRLDKLEVSINNLLVTVSQNNKEQNNVWSKYKDALIGALIGVVAMLITKIYM